MTHVARGALLLPLLLAACQDPAAETADAAPPADAAPSADVRDYNPDCGVVCEPPPELHRQVPGTWTLALGTPEAGPACPVFDHPTREITFTATLSRTGEQMRLAVSGEGRALHQSDEATGILTPDGNVRVFFELDDSSWGDHHGAPVTPTVFYDLHFHPDDSIDGDASTELSWPAQGADPAQTCVYRLSLTGTRTP
jgi:hypothetical protein